MDLFQAFLTLPQDHITVGNRVLVLRFPQLGNDPDTVSAELLLIHQHLSAI
jgi:hypothetical protein